MEEFSVKEWLNYYFERFDIDENRIKPILYFSLLWNLFENTYFTDDNHLSAPKLIKLSELSYEALNDDELNPIFDFFKNRYYQNLIINNRFNLLQIHQHHIELCREILIKDIPTKLEKTKFLFLVIHRFRNNLFHGRKTPRTLNIYEDAFNRINSFLMKFIESTSENDKINNNRKI